MEDRPIIVKRVKKGGGGHHGGAWKVAFADFAMALMAFFLVMWVTQTATPEQKQAIQAYFRDPIGFQEGGLPTPIDLGGTPRVRETIRDPTPLAIDAEEDAHQIQRLFDELQTRIQESETLKAFEDQLLLELTDEGLRIQIVDQSQRPMFASGSAQLMNYSEDILFELAEPLGRVRNKLSIAGYTDSTPFRGRTGYSNWELSADRANTARRTLVAAGVDGQQISRVVGLADSVLFDEDNPTAPVNRRISITVLNQQVSEAMRERDSGGPRVIDLTGEGADQDDAFRDLQEGDWIDRARRHQVEEDEVRW